MTKFLVGQTTISSTVTTRVTTFAAEWVKGIQLKALSGNAAAVYIGGSDVAATGFPLLPGEGLFLPLDAVDEIYGLAATNGDKISWIIV